MTGSIRIRLYRIVWVLADFCLSWGSYCNCRERQTDDLMQRIPATLSFSHQSQWHTRTPFSLALSLLNTNTTPVAANLLLMDAVHYQSSFLEDFCHFFSFRKSSCDSNQQLFKAPSVTVWLFDVRKVTFSWKMAQSTVPPMHHHTIMLLGCLSSLRLRNSAAYMRGLISWRPSLFRSAWQMMSCSYVPKCEQLFVFSCASESLHKAGATVGVNVVNYGWHVV